VATELIPGLAEEWEMTGDAKTWTFQIRKGVPFHKGWGELTAVDVKYSIERGMDLNSIAGPSSQLGRADVTVHRNKNI